MRHCPVCSSENRVPQWRSEFLVPETWTLPQYLDWMQCGECGMLYGDNMDAKQSDYDEFYTTKYGYGVADEANQKRLIDRAIFIKENFDINSKIVDFGGGESGLTKFLAEFGFSNTFVVGCTDIMPENADIVVAEHVLEHIYDLDAAMDRITKSLKPRGILIVDVPDAGSMAYERPIQSPMLDFTQVHINHFRVIDMLKLAQRYGFELLKTTGYDERHGGCRMYVFIKDKWYVSKKSHWYTVSNVALNVEKLRDITEPVVVWGCGDIAMHCLAKFMPKISYFVDMNPAYRGAYIRGIPVLDKVVTDETIVVIAQSQKGAILDNIKKLGLKNKVIII